MKVEEKIYIPFGHILFKFVTTRSIYVINKTFLSTSYLTERPFCHSKLPQKKIPCQTYHVSRTKIQKGFSKKIYSVNHDS